MKDSTVLASLSELLGEGGAHRVLIVEDESFVRDGLAIGLSSLGNEVDAREGVERSELPVGLFDVAILDGYFLSSTLTGVTLVPELRKANPAIRIVGISSDAAMNARMISMGADAAWPKSAVRRLL